MKIISKRGRPVKPPVSDIHEIEMGDTGFGLIIIDGAMTAEQIRQAEEAFQEIRRQLDEMGHIWP
jgi:hypothetical protein